MADFTLAANPAFPAGTSVGAYRFAEAAAQRNSAPPGAADATATTAADGRTSFTGLTEGAAYWAAAQVGGAWRYIAFHPGQDAVGAPVVTSELLLAPAPEGDPSANVAGLQEALDAMGPRDRLLAPSGASYDTDDSLQLGQGAALLGPWDLDCSNAGVPALIFPDDMSGDYQTGDVALEDMRIVAAGDGISIPNGSVGSRSKIGRLYIEPGGKGIHAKGFLQDLSWGIVEVNGGTYGLFHDNEPGEGGQGQRIDVCGFDYLYCHGQSQVPVWLRCSLANNSHFGRLRVVTGAKHGALICGGFEGLTIDSFNSEANGYGGPASYVAPTTGAITTGTKTLTVASAAGLHIGDTLTVEGAGAAIGAPYGSLDHVSVIDNIVGTTVTLHDNAGTTVAGARVTSALYSDLYMGTDPGPVAGGAATGGGPRDVVFGFLSVGVSALRGDNNIRYGANFMGANEVAIGKALANDPNRPIFDPFQQVKGDIFTDAVVRPDPRPVFTQTYAGAAKTVPADTASDLATTAATQTTPWGFASQAQAEAIATKVNQVRADALATKQVLNALLDELQLKGKLR